MLDIKMGGGKTVLRCFFYVGGGCRRGVPGVQYLPPPFLGVRPNFLKRGGKDARECVNKPRFST